MRPPKILAFAGSARKESHNKRLVQVAAQGAQEAGAEVTLLNLADYPLPLYDEDDERDHGLPENVLRLKQIFLEHDGLLVACPEYNGSITPLLKNTIDWVSRPRPGEKRLAPFQDKVAVLMSAAPGSVGGLRGLVHVRAILTHVGVIVLPKQIAIAQSGQAFQEDGSLRDPSQHEVVTGLGQMLANFLCKLQNKA